MEKEKRSQRLPNKKYEVNLTMFLSGNLVTHILTAILGQSWDIYVS